MATVFWDAKGILHGNLLEGIQDFYGSQNLYRNTAMKASTKSSFQPQQ